MTEMKHLFVCSTLTRMLIDTINEQKKRASEVNRWHDLDYKIVGLKRAITVLRENEGLKSKIIELEAEIYNREKGLR